MRIGSIVLSLACLAGCQASAPRSEPAPAPAPKAMPAPPAPPPPAPPPAAKPVSADLSKFKGPADNVELFGYDDGAGRIFMYTAGTVEIPVAVAADGAYEIVVKVACDEAMGQKAKFTVAVDGQGVGGEISCTTVDEKDYAVKVQLKAGERKIAVAFLNDLYKENEYDLNMFVSGLTIKPLQ